MSHAELVRRAHAAYTAAFESRDPEVILALIDPGVEWHTRAEVMEGAYRGHDGVRRWLNEFWEGWQELELETEEVVEGANDRVFAAVRARGLGRASGARVDMRLYEILEIRDGRISRRLAFPDRASALEALGGGQAGATDT